jgi:hypothetical protein
MSQQPIRQFATGDIHLSRFSTAALTSTKLYLSSETQDCTFTLAEAIVLADFLRDQQTHPQQVARLEALKEHIRRGEATRGGVNTILYEIMVTYLPTELLHHVQEIQNLLVAEIQKQKKMEESNEQSEDTNTQS